MIDPQSSYLKATHHMCHPSLLLLELVKSIHNVCRGHTTLCKLQARRLSSSPSKNMERCIAQIRQWLSQNCLKLNDGKTELMVIGQPTQLKKITSDTDITISDSVISASSSVCNIGAVLDSGLSMDEQFKNICRSCIISLRSLSKIRSCLTEDSATTRTHAFITCKLDNLNSLLTGPYMDTKLNRLQLIQNHAARIITLTKKFNHISGVLKKLH